MVRVGLAWSGDGIPALSYLLIHGMGISSLCFFSDPTFLCYIIDLKRSYMPSSLTQKFPATNGIRWFNVAVFAITTLIAVYGLLTVKLRRDTVFFSVAYYIFSMLGELHIFLHLLTDTHDTSPLHRHHCR